MSFTIGLRKRNVSMIFKCEQCDETFRRPLDLKNHCSAVHQTPSKRFMCSLCDKSYSTKQSLNSHLSKEHKSPEKKFNEQSNIASPIKSQFTNKSIIIMIYILIAYVCIDV